MPAHLSPGERTLAGAGRSRAVTGGVARWTLPAVSALVFFTLLVVSGRRWADGTADLLSWRLLPLGLASALLYVSAHVMRAVRLAVIAMPLLGLSFRTAALLHMFVAPWSLVMPFKLDELIRFYELHRASKSWSRSAVALVIDRSMDGVVLVAMAVLLLLAGRTVIAGLLFLVGVGLMLIILALFTLPVLLEAVQRHMFANHYKDRAIRILRAVNTLRLLLMSGRATIGRTGPFLVIATVLIWGLESAAAVVLLCFAGPAASPPLEALELMLQRADDSWRVLTTGAPASAPIVLLTLVFFWGLLPAWAPATWLYMRRRAGEPRRPRPLQTAEPLLRRG